MICETNGRDCDVCELIEKGVRFAGSYYFAGVLAGLYYADRRRTPLCPIHFAEWKRMEAEIRKSPLIDEEAAQ